MANSADGAAIVNLAVGRFDDFDLPVTINNDLTGATFEAEVRLLPDASGAALATMTSTVPDVTAGITTFTMSIPQATVEALPAGEGGGDAKLYWDLQQILMTKRTTLFRGTFTVLGGVTQP